MRPPELDQMLVDWNRTTMFCPDDRCVQDLFTDQVARTKPRIDYVTRGLDDVAFRNPDGSDVLLVHDDSGHPIRFAVGWRGRSFTANLPAQATATFIW